MDWNKLKANALHYASMLEQKPENLSALALLSARFPELSPLNLIALQIQCPAAEYLRPAGEWMQGRMVQIRPQQGVVHLYHAASTSYFSRGEEELPLSAATLEEQYKIQTGKLPSKKRVFPVAQSYFDITQTKIPEEEYGKYLPTPPLAALEPEKRFESLLLFAADMEFEVREKAFLSPLTHSQYWEEKNRIELAENLPLQEKTTALLHELATGIFFRTSTPRTVPSIRDFETETLFAGLSHQCGYSLNQPFVENLKAVCRSIDLEKFDIGESFSRVSKANRFTVQGITEVSQTFTRTHEPKRELSVRENFLQEL